jgi:hypothetical protein
MSGRSDLEPRQLFERRVVRDTAKLRAYDHVYKQIELRIRTTAELPSNPNYVLYTVPPFILGLPAIDMQDCIVYIVHKLRTSGFMVRFTYPNLLYISWQHYEQEYMRDQNPITQAMKPPAPPTNSSKKGTTGKRGMGASTGSAQRVTFAPELGRIGGAPAAARSAAEYKPPDSFLEGIQRPTKSSSGASTESVLSELWKF